MIYHFITTSIFVNVMSYMTALFAISSIYNNINVLYIRLMDINYMHFLYPTIICIISRCIAGFDAFNIIKILCLYKRISFLFIYSIVCEILYIVFMITNKFPIYFYTIVNFTTNSNNNGEVINDIVNVSNTSYTANIFHYIITIIILMIPEIIILTLIIIISLLTRFMSNITSRNRFRSVRIVYDNISYLFNGTSYGFI